MPFNRRKFLQLAGEGAAGITLFKGATIPFALRADRSAVEPSKSFDP